MLSCIALHCYYNVKFVC